MRVNISQISVPSTRYCWQIENRENYHSLAETRFIYSQLTLLADVREYARIRYSRRAVFANSAISKNEMENDYRCHIIDAFRRQPSFVKKVPIFRLWSAWLQFDGTFTPRSSEIASVIFLPTGQ